MSANSAKATRTTLSSRPTLAIDFDGVVHAYSQGWQDGVIYDHPSPGTRDALRQLAVRHRLVLFTARHDLDAVHMWLVANNLRHFFSDITNSKPAAVAYIDDRGIRFTNWRDTLEALRAAQK